MDNIQGLQESALVVLGGLVTETNASNLPAGAAPVCCDADFTVQSVFTRDGLAPTYTNTGGFEIESPSLAVDVNEDGQPWITPPNIELNAPPLYAHVTLNSPGNTPYPEIGTIVGGVLNAPPGGWTFSPPDTGYPVGTLFLFVAQAYGPDTITISDTLGNTWIPLAATGDAFYVWYAHLNSLGADTYTITTTTYNVDCVIFPVIQTAGVPPSILTSGNSVTATGTIDSQTAEFLVSGSGALTTTLHTSGLTDGVNTVSITGGNAGSGYAPTDFVQLSGAGDSNALFTIDTVGGGGTVLTGHISSIGSGYSVASGVTTTAQSGIGTGLELDILTIGAGYRVSDTFNIVLDGSLPQTSDATGHVTGVTSNGEITTYALDAPGTAYKAQTNVPISATSGVGVGASLNIISVAATAINWNLLMVQCPASDGISPPLLIAVTDSMIGAIPNADNYIGSASWNYDEASDPPFFQLYVFAGSEPGPDFSDILRTSNYGFTIPADATITGIKLTVAGYQDSVNSDAIITTVPTGGPGTQTYQLGSSQGTTIFGGQNFPSIFGQTFTPSQINSSGFGFDFQVFDTSGNQTTFNLSSAIVEVWYQGPIVNYDWIGSYPQTDGEILTLALDADGTFWQEDVLNSPGVLSPFYTEILPDTFAVGITEDNREFIALSNLQNGTDMPRQYNGQWLDRVSQVGPGAPPAITPTSNGYAISTITQASPEVLGDGTKDYTVTWTANFGSIGPAGNILSFESFPGNFADIIAAGIGATVIISGVQTLNGQDPNNSIDNPTYTVIACGTVNTAFWGPNSSYFSVQALTTNHIDVIVQPGATYQLTLATLTAAETVPNLQVGNQMIISGTSLSGYDSTWTVTATPNASQLNITQTSLSSNMATYVYTLITGVDPIVGQQVTVTGTSNGDGIFNVFDQVITSASAGSFSIALVSPNIPPAAETGSGIVNGTIFQFDPMIFIGNSTGGEITIAGGLGAGTRGCVVMFLTRNGYLTAPSPQLIFTLSEDASALTVSNIPIGPPNVTARVLAFTGANGATQTGGGGFYYWIPTPVKVIDNGQTVTYTATIINDNTTTQATLSFTDAVLLASDGISIDGSNNFNEIEIGSCLGFISYAERLFAWGEQNKIQNLINFSFDGGVGQSTGVSLTTFPLGWTVDPTNGSGGSLIASPIFGNAYQILNSSGSTQAVWGMITQPAFQDSFGVPIIFGATTYSIRVTASSTTASGNLVVDLYSPSLNFQYGQFIAPLAGMTSNMQIFTGNLLTNEFAVVPTDLVIRIYATTIPNGGSVLLDRIEPYPTLNPVLTTQLRASYADNFEAFDQVTGNLGATQNQQPVVNVFELFDNLYIVKSGSLYSTSDNGTTEPNFWNVREVSNKVGACSIHAVDVGEGWALMASKAGLYLFAGGDPVKISPELDGEPGLWQSISWQYGYTIWLRNDTETRHIYIGVPIPTPNQWMPRFPVNANPTQPNVVLVCNYKELMASGALESEGPLRITYTGELKSFSFGRKWSTWSIEAGFADFITRADTTAPLFYLGDTAAGGIFQQVTGLHTDAVGNGPIFDYYTYGFPKTQEAEQKQMSVGQYEAVYSTILVRGSGSLAPTLYPDSIFSSDAVALYPEPLADPLPYGDMEIPLNEIGNRFFYEFSLIGAGAWCEIGRVVMWIKESSWAPVRGSNGD